MAHDHDNEPQEFLNKIREALQQLSAENSRLRIALLNIFFKVRERDCPGCRAIHELARKALDDD